MGCASSTKKVTNPVSASNTKSQVLPKGAEIHHARELKFQHATFISHKSSSISKDYSIGAKLGSGAFGTVQRAIHRSTGQQRAIKSVRKAQITQDMKDRTQFFNEIDILRETDHPNIVRLYEFYEDRTCYHMVTELLSGGELFDFIIKHKHLSESIAAHFCKQILSAVAYCHAKGIVHRDLKPENLLLDSDSSSASVKVIDFGTSALFDPSERMHHRYGTAYYIAPEVLRKNYDSKCDIWSCGVILYILLSGAPPFYGRTDEEILQKVSKGRYSMNSRDWDRISIEAKDLIKSMLSMDPSNRPTAIEALKDPWFTKASLSPEIERETIAQSLENLKKFHADEKLQQAVMGFITSQLVSKEDLRQLTSSFSKLDANGDGKLSRDELIAGYLNTMTAKDAEDEVDRIMNEVDTDENGYIEYSEFVTATMKRERLLSKENLEAAFSMFDIDGSGTISAAELRALLGAERRAADNVWQELISQVDQNGDGEIDIKEFKEMMLKLF